jgi:hypothetical protein
MKKQTLSSAKVILFFGYILFYLSGKAQGYVPIPLDSSQWVVSSGGGWSSGGLCTCSYDFEYKSAGDTVVGAYTYSKIIHAGPYGCSCGGGTRLGGILRQDTLGRKVYVIFQDSVKEDLLYDFTQNKNDTLKSILVAKGACPSPWVIDSVDHKWLAGKYRKRMRLRATTGMAPCTGGGWFIEGIGSTMGLLEPLTLPEYGSYLQCMSHVGKTLFPDSISSCIFVGINEQRAAAVYYQVYPNPAQGDFNVSSTSGILEELTVTDLTGRVIYCSYPRAPKTQIRLSVPGIYFVKAFTPEGMSARRIIITEH